MTAFLNGLRNESRDVAVSQLLHYLPLLRPANTDGVRGYDQLLPKYILFIDFFSFFSFGFVYSFCLFFLLLLLERDNGVHISRRPSNVSLLFIFVLPSTSLLASFLEDDQQTHPSSVANNGNGVGGSSGGGATGQYQSSEMQQLLTYALVHPALSLESKRYLLAPHIQAIEIPALKLL